MDSKQFEALIADADTRLSRLRSIYDQWFAGVERVEPLRQREGFDRLMQVLHRECPNNTACRFRHQQLIQRYLTYTTYWRRISRQIEEGTYRRDVAKARKQRQERETNRSTLDSFEFDVDVDLDTLLEAVATHPSSATEPEDATAGSTSAALHGQQEQPGEHSMSRGSTRAPNTLPPRPASIPPRFRQPEPLRRAVSNSDRTAAPRATQNQMPVRQPKALPQGQLSERQIQHIYDRFLAARARNSERTDNVKLATVAKSVHGMMPKLLRKHAGKEIDFEVVVRDGKVALKPVAK